MKEKLKYIAVYLNNEKYKKFREYCFYADKSMSLVINELINLILKEKIEKQMKEIK